MGSVPSELSLDLGPTFVPKTISDFLRDVSTNGNVTDKVLKLDDFVQRLEDEMKKIDAFKRELPLCMLLLNDAILILKEESLQCRRPNSQPVLEEFIPLKKECEQNEEHKKEKDCRDKKNWMSSVQLWNSDDFPTTNDTCEPKQNSKIDNKKNEEESGLAAENLFPSCINRKAGMLFMPFKSYSGVPLPTVVRKEQKEELPIPGLSLLTPRIKNLREESGSSGSGTSCSRGVSSSGPSAQSKLQTGPRQPTARKQRRCWSPELHRRFVNALQQLGGSHAATPKQIRELMQVDGLTNDEVKSHLQKYRLHTRRPPAAAASPTNQSVVVLGGLWMPQDLYGDSSKGSSSQSGSPQGPLQLERSGGGTSLVGSDSMDDDEDAKSESYSWKTHVHVPEKVDI
ncbi:myb family transcription factor EFM-like [Quillaja saponaria]|uniref:Myb family transcription factor EFM-like n=1 Tax=Quillaja saponaria TaxID=32244 RepID=A0AAD7KUJ7_QUISA|nr:myb family transcription factor EFM-like [Quillaja saponaria]